LQLDAHVSELKQRQLGAATGKDITGCFWAFESDNAERWLLQESPLCSSVRV
jgi:hypothetical protein